MNEDLIKDTKNENEDENAEKDELGSKIIQRNKRDICARLVFMQLLCVVKRNKEIPYVLCTFV